MQARALIELFGSALDRAIVLSNLARIEIQRRDGARAIEWVALARETGCDAFPITQAVAISEAEALTLVVSRAARSIGAPGRRTRSGVAAAARARKTGRGNRPSGAFLKP